MSSNPISWFEIYVQDMARARTFYEGVLQITLTPLSNAMPELWAFPSDMERYGASGALARMDGCPSGGSGTLVYFHCDDCGGTAGRVPGAGGQVVKPKFPIGDYGFIALALDTEGNLFGMHSMA